jgi:hypothetical protein
LNTIRRHAAQIVVCLIATVCAAAAPAQVAYVYVPTVNGIYAFDASSAGTLTAIKGSPFAATILSITGNGKFIFGVDWNYTSIDTFTMESNGAVKFVRSTSLKSHAPGLTNLSSLTMDHTGQTLYVGADVGNTDINPYLSFTVEKSTGVLSYLGSVPSESAFPPIPTFSGNNSFAYAGNDPYFGFNRLSDGLLTESPYGYLWPLPAPNDSWIQPTVAAADPNGHVAMAFQSINTGESQLAVYTANKEGHLTTASTYKNMPTTANHGVFNLSMSPSGKLLAVAGSQGLEVFHFNGGSPITGYTPLLTLTGAFSSSHWDNDNHLYSLNDDSGRLHVYEVTPTSYKEEPGSPYTTGRADQAYDVFVYAK